MESIGFADRVREICAPSYADARLGGRPGIDPAVYFKMLMVGFFEDLPSERAIAWRCGDGISVRKFLGYSLTEATPDHSSLSVIRDRLSEAQFRSCSEVVLRGLLAHGLLDAQRLGIDSSVIEANAALRSLRHRDSKKQYWEYVRDLAAEAGVDPNDVAAVRRFDRKREGRRTSNKEWVNPHDPDAKVGQTKDGATDMVYHPEHVIDLDSGAAVSVEVRLGDTRDTQDLNQRLSLVQVMLQQLSGDKSAQVVETAVEITAGTAVEVVPNVPEEIVVAEEISVAETVVVTEKIKVAKKKSAPNKSSKKKEGSVADSVVEAVAVQGAEAVSAPSTGAAWKVDVAADKGYFALEEIAALQAQGVRTVIADPHRDRRRKDLKPEERAVLERAHDATQSEDGKALLKKRGQHVERSFCHILDHGGMRRATLRGQSNLTKRLIAAALSFNLSLLLRVKRGCGTLKQWLASSKKDRQAWAALKNALRSRRVTQIRRLTFLKTVFTAQLNQFWILPSRTLQFG